MRRKSVLTVFFLVFVIALAGTFILKSSLTSKGNTRNQSVPQFQSKTFESENLDFSTKVPSDFEIEDGNTSVLIKKGDAEIIVVRNGTEFPDLASYLQDFDIRNRWEIIEEDELVINGYQARARTFMRTSTSKTRERMIFLYVNYSVYKISTNSESLFNDLDLVSQSFRYTP